MSIDVSRPDPAMISRATFGRRRSIAALGSVGMLALRHREGSAMEAASGRRQGRSSTGALLQFAGSPVPRRPSARRRRWTRASRRCARAAERLPRAVLLPVATSWPRRGGSRTPAGTDDRSTSARAARHVPSSTAVGRRPVRGAEDEVVTVNSCSSIQLRSSVDEHRGIGTERGPVLALRVRQVDVCLETSMRSPSGGWEAQRSRSSR